MRWATVHTLQPYQILCLPRKINLMIDPHHIWTSFTMRGAKVNALQTYQILRLPRKMNLMIDPHHIWNVTYNARSNSPHPVTSPNIAPATQNDSHDGSASHMKRHLQCAEQQSTPSNLTKYCACHAIWISWLIRITYETSFTMRGATVNTLQRHQILRLPRNMNLMIDPHHIWNVIYNARSNSPHPPTSANTAPATQNESHAWSASLMKRHLQCAEQQSTPSNLTKYCACHAKWPSNIWQKFDENSWNLIYNARPIRDRSDHKLAHRNPSRHRGYFSHSRRSRFYWKLQRFPLRLSFQISPNTAPATQSNTWTSPNAAPATKSDTWTSPNVAPATQNESHDWSASHMKRHLQCAEQQSTPSDLTKYCACHAKWPSNIWQKFDENSWNLIYNARAIRDRSDHDPTINSPTATRRATEAIFHTRQEQILLKITTFPAPAIIPNFTKCCACHEK